MGQVAQPRSGVVPTHADSLGPAQLAEQSGVSLARVQQLADLGALSSTRDGPFPVTDIQRVRVVEALESSGIGLEDISAGIRQGALSLEFVDAVFPRPFALSPLTVREVAARTQLPLELVRYLYTMWGLPVPDPDEPMRKDDVALWEIQALLPPEGHDEHVITTTNRLFAEGMRKVVVSCVEYFRETIERPLRAADVPPGEMLDSLGRSANQLLPLADGIVQWGLQRFMEHALLEYFLEIVEEAAEAQGISRRRDAAHPAIGFLDLTGFTVLSETQGAERAAELAVSLARLVQETAQLNSGRLVKLLGDGAMFYFRRPADAVACGLELVERVPREGLPSARMGVSAGPVVFKDGDYFGRTVNLAARIADYARPNEVLVSAEVAGEAASPSLEFDLVGPVELKGVSGLVTLHSAHRSHDGPENAA